MLSKTSASSGLHDIVERYQGDFGSKGYVLFAVKQNSDVDPVNQTTLVSGGEIKFRKM